MSLPPPRPDRLVSTLLREQAAQRPQKEALVYPAFLNGGHALRLSFAQLDAEVDRLARGLVALGIRRGEHVAVWAANVPSWVPLEFALARIGAVLVTVNTSLQAEEVDYVLRQSHAVAVIHTTRNGSNEASATLDGLLTGPEADALGERLRLRLWMPTLPDDAPPSLHAPSGGEAITLAELLSRGEAIPLDEVLAREEALDPEDVINIQYTSGTTGFPKGVMLSHVNMMTSAYALGDELELTADDRVVLMVPLFHCFGCVVAVLGTFTFGASLHALPGFDAEQVLRLIHEERCTVIHGVPTMYGAMIAHESRAQYDTSSLRTGLAAGAPCPVPLMTAIRDALHCEGILVAYGLTEASPGVSGCRPGDTFEDRSETIGRPIHAVEMRIADPETNQLLGDGAEGEIQVHGPNVMVGYHDEPEATAAAMTPDGWLRTGDLGVRGADGLYRVVGRIKDIVIRGGENIAPAEIENLLRAHPDILDVAVVGIPDDFFGEEVAAALRLAPGKSLDAESYTASLGGHIASFKMPKVYRVFDSFPLTGSGKVKKFLLSQWIVGGGEGG
jgi:acyl-CoA synthetase (AMP-forming)/AMP-acid ligase II